MDALVDLSFATALVFARAGGVIMLMPGVGDPGVPARIRLAFALLLALAAGPALSPELPAIPADPWGLAMLFGGETLVGLAFGALARLVLSAVSIAGYVMGMQSGLGMAQAFDPAQNQSGALFSIFLNLTAVTLIFVTDLHHLLIGGIRGSYGLVPAGAIGLGGGFAGDFAEFALSASADAIALAIRMAAPILVFSLVFNAAFGVLNKLMPQAQVFFIAMPAGVILSLAALSSVLGMIMLVFLTALEEHARLIAG